MILVDRDADALAEKHAELAAEDANRVRHFTVELTDGPARDRLIDAVAGGQLKVSVNQTLPLEQCAEAHRQLEARETTGSTVLKI